MGAIWKLIVDFQMAPFHFCLPPSSTPPQLGQLPTPKIYTRLVTRKRREIVSVSTDKAFYDGLSWGTTAHLLTPPSPNLGTVRKQNVYGDWLIKEER